MDADGTGELLDDRLADAPASAKLVWLELDRAQRPLTKADLIERTRLSKRTIEFGLRILLETGLITRLRRTRRREHRYLPAPSP